MVKNYYEVLGVKKEASAEDIKKSYRRMALQLHPDKNKETNAEEKLKELAEAYEVLSNKQKRDAYDRHGDKGVKHGFKSYSGGNTDPHDLFKRFFNGQDPFSTSLSDLFASSFPNIISKLFIDITNMQVYSAPNHSSAAEELVPVFSRTCQMEALQPRTLIHLMKEFQSS
jgi:DnaJ-class molecular chaperone